MNDSRDIAVRNQVRDLLGVQPLLHSHPSQPRRNPHSSPISASVVIVEAITVAILDRLGSTQHCRSGLSTVRDKVLTFIPLEHDPHVSVCTTTTAWTMIRL
jgi:hypothetical protein